MRETEEYLERKNKTLGITDWLSKELEKDYCQTFMHAREYTWKTYFCKGEVSSWEVHQYDL